MSKELIKQNLELQISNMQPRYKNWDGDLIDLNGCDKDNLCYAFLLQMKSWWDDCLPAMSERQQTALLDELYRGENSKLSNMMKDEIYLTLEPTLRDVVQEVYDELNHVQPEPFAGYERGQ